MANASNQSVSINDNPISLVFAFCAEPNQLFSIDALKTLPLRQQLDILNVNKIHDTESRDTLIRNLCSQIPALKDSASNQQLLQSVLSEFYQQHTALQLISPSEWDQKQIAFSLLCYMMDRLRRKPIDDDDRKEFEKDMKWQHTMWLFIHYLMNYCDDHKWDGIKMKEYWDNVTQNGKKTNGFALEFAKLICTEYGLKLGKYARVRKMLPIWYIAALGVDSEDDEKVSEQFPTNKSSALTDGLFS